jgi:hypothetical protein
MTTEMEQHLRELGEKNTPEKHFILIDPNNSGAIQDRNLMTPQKAERWNQLRRSNGSDLRWIIDREREAE